MKYLLTTMLLTMMLQSFAPRHNLIIKEIKNNKLTHKEKLIMAIAIKESGSESMAYNKSEDAVGILQIRKTYLDECNRLAHKKFTYNDRWDADKSIEIFNIIMNHWCPSYNIDTVAMIHNSGGISNHKYLITKEYREDIRRIFKTL